MTGRSPSGRATHEPGLATRPGHSVSVPNAENVAPYLRKPSGDCFAARAEWYERAAIEFGFGHGCCDPRCPDHGGGK